MTYTAKARLIDNIGVIFGVTIISKKDMRTVIECINNFCKHDYNILSISIEADTDNV